MLKLNSRSNTIKVLAHIGLMLTMCAWGTSFLSTKVLMTDGGFTPVEMYVYRFLAAYLILLAFTFKNLFANSWKDELQLFICGLCAGSLFFITENYALKFTATANVSLLASISPIFTTILMAVIYKVKMRFGVILGSIIAFIGVGCIIFSSGAGFEIHPKGDILALTAAFSWAIYTIAVKKVSPFYSTFFISRKIFFYGVLTAIPLMLMQNEPLHFRLLFDFTQPQYPLNFLFLVIFCSLFAYLILNEAMNILGQVTANNYLYLQPLVTMIAAYFILGEQIFVLGYVGCLLIIGGLVISDKMK